MPKNVLSNNKKFSDFFFFYKKKIENLEMDHSLHTYVSNWECFQIDLVHTTIYKSRIQLFIATSLLHFFKYSPSKETTVPAILAGRGLRAAGIDRRLINPDVDIVVDVDMALPGLDVFIWPPGVTVPDREPILV